MSRQGLQKERAPNTHLHHGGAGWSFLGQGESNNSNNCNDRHANSSASTHTNENKGHAGLVSGNARPCKSHITFATKHGIRMPPPWAMISKTQTNEGNWCPKHMGLAKHLG